VSTSPFTFKEADGIRDKILKYDLTAAVMMEDGGDGMKGWKKMRMALVEKKDMDSNKLSNRHFLIESRLFQVRK
jgi:hypothetical protein